MFMHSYNNPAILTVAKISKFSTRRATLFHLKCFNSATLAGFSIVSEVAVLKYKGYFSLFEN